MEPLLSGITPPGFIFLVQKIIKGHPDFQNFREPFKEEYLRRKDELPSHSKHILLYSFGKIGLVTPCLVEEAKKYIDNPNSEPHSFLNALIYGVSTSSIENSYFPKIENRMVSLLKSKLDLTIMKSISKGIHLLQSVNYPTEQIMKHYINAIVELGLEADQYLTRLLDPSQLKELNQDSKEKLESIKQNSPYLQSKLAYYLAKGGFKVELEPLLGNSRVDIKVEDVCIEVDGQFVKANINNQLNKMRDEKNLEECQKAGLRYLVLHTKPDEDWKSDKMLPILNLLNQPSKGLSV